MIMKEKFKNLNETFEIETSKDQNDLIISSESSSVELQVDKTQNDITNDYEYTRGNLYSLIEKGQEAIDGIMEIAGEGGSARAYEVAGQLIKSVGDVTDKLIDLQKKLKEVEDDSPKSTNNTTNNAIFVGSTSELSKILKQGFINTKE